MGSTDEQGNRLSNMPGEERPSLQSVTPYDDDPEQLAGKVEQLVKQAQEEKERAKQKKAAEISGTSDGQQYKNLAEKIKAGQASLMQSKKVIANGGK